MKWSIPERQVRKPTTDAAPVETAEEVVKPAKVKTPTKKKEK